MWYSQENDTVIIHVYIQPGAKSTEIAGFYGDELKIRLNSPPIDGRANEALLKYVAHLYVKSPLCFSMVCDKTQGSFNIR